MYTHVSPCVVPSGNIFNKPSGKPKLAFLPVIAALLFITLASTTCGSSGGKRQVYPSFRNYYPYRATVPIVLPKTPKYNDSIAKSIAATTRQPMYNYNSALGTIRDIKRLHKIDTTTIISHKDVERWQKQAISIYNPTPKAHLTQPANDVNKEPKQELPADIAPIDTAAV